MHNTKFNYVFYNTFIYYYFMLSSGALFAYSSLQITNLFACVSQSCCGFRTELTCRRLLSKPTPTLFTLNVISVYINLTSDNRIDYLTNSDQFGKLKSEIPPFFHIHFRTVCWINSFHETVWEVSARFCIYIFNFV